MKTLQNRIDLGELMAIYHLSTKPISRGQGRSAKEKYWMPIKESHRTPDGQFSFIVEEDETGNLNLGFEGFSWHTHGDVLASAGVSAEVAVRRFVDDLLAGRTLIGISRIDNQIHDVWIADRIKTDKYKPPNEIIEFRYWDGSVASLQK